MIFNSTAKWMILTDSGVGVMNEWLCVICDQTPPPIRDIFCTVLYRYKPINSKKNRSLIMKDLVIGLIMCSDSDNNISFLSVWLFYLKLESYWLFSQCSLFLYWNHNICYLYIMLHCFIHAAYFFMFTIIQV